MKIVLDDRRNIPGNSPYNLVRTYVDCVELLRLFRRISFISLDYNLGAERSGLDVLVYMFENRIEIRHINIHSDHIIGVPRMRDYAFTHFPNVEITFNPL